LTRDISEYLAGVGIKPAPQRPSLTVAYHSACSLQHGQKVHREPKDLLAACGFVVKEIAEGHLCCGSAGSYNILQPDIAGQLRDRKISNIDKTAPDIIAAGNIGCMTQIASGTTIPAVHTVELVDWATGGPMPEQLKATLSS
jgi:glycolate oxidase iron-sulfur subunit